MHARKERYDRISVHKESGQSRSFTASRNVKHAHFKKATFMMFIYMRSIIVPQPYRAAGHEGSHFL